MSLAVNTDSNEKSDGHCNWKAIGARLKSLREASGCKTQREFAETLGATVGQYNHWECGQRIVPVEYAAEIKLITGGTLDYIYLGNPSALPLHLAVKIGIIPQNPRPAPEDA